MVVEREKFNRRFGADYAESHKRSCRPVPSDGIDVRTVVAGFAA